MIVWLLITLVFSGFVLHIQRENEDKIRQYNDESFISYSNSYEQVFRSLIDVTRNVKNLNTLDLFALSSKDTYYRRMTELYTELQRLSGLLPGGGYNIAVHKVNDHTVVTNRNSRRLEDVLDELGISQQTYREMLANPNEKSLHRENVIFTDDTLIYVSQKDYVDTRMIILLYAPLSSLNLYPLEAGVPVSLLLHDDKIIDLRTQKSDTVPLLLEQGREHDPGQIFRQTFESQNYTGRKSAYLNLVYYYQTESGISQETLTLLVKLFLLLILVCAAAFLIMVIFSLRIYRPIDRMVGTLLHFDSDGSTPAQKNEIDYIMQKVLSIRNDNKALVQKLDDNLRRLKEQVVLSLLQNTYDEETIGNDLKRTGLEWLGKSTTLVLFEFQMTEAERYSYDLDITEKMLRLLEEQVQAQFTAQRILTYDNRPCFLLKDASPTLLKKILSEIITVIDTAFSLSLKAYIAPTSEDYHSLHACFLTANRIAENKQRMLYKSIYDFEDGKNLSAHSSVYPLRDEAALIFAAENADAAELTRQVDYIFAEYVEKAFKSKEQKQYIFFALVNTINRILQQAGLEWGSIVGEAERILGEMQRCDTSERLKSYVCALFDRILKERKNSDQLKAENFKGSLEQYLQENLQRDISLLDLAEHFSLSPNYMSTLFKSTIGDNFKDYISRLRFDKATMILRQDPNVKLAELGSQIGIHHVNTLIRLFKKYSGKSPGQYGRDNLGR